jgi:phosphoribosyl 1,2-cyclic phosphodiesterase
MALQVASIASGSNGNCYYVENEQEAVLVDVGISCKELEKRMKRLGISMEKVKAIFISHEHADHICGLATTAKKYAVPVYITTATLRAARTFIPKLQICSFSAGEPVTIGSLAVTAFTKRHDAADAHSFVISNANTTVGVFTDIGLPCEQVIRYFRLCHAVFLESNYDEDMLMKGSYPYYLKHRIHGDQGHLSNRQALQLFLQHKSPALRHLFLSHLSKNNNCPHLVQDLFTRHAGSVQITVASRYEETPLYRIDPVQQMRSSLLIQTPAQLQLRLSFEEQ